MGLGTTIKAAYTAAKPWMKKGISHGWNDVGKPAGEGFGKALARSSYTSIVATSAVAAGGVKYLITGKGLLDQAKDMFFGKPNSDGSESEERGNGVGDTVANSSGQVSETSTMGGLDELSEMVSNFFGGGKSWLQMIQNFGSNLFSGKMSGMSMAGLVLSGLLIFGKGGLLGKIAGALLAMAIVAMNSDNKVQQQTGGRAVRPAQETDRAAGLDADTIQTQMQSNYERAASGAEEAVEMNQHRG